MKDTFDTFLNYALVVLGKRMLSEYELQQKLMQKFPDISSEEIPKILSFCRERKYVDDELFTKMWIEYRRDQKKKGKQQISYELGQKGISEEMREKVFASVEFDELSLAKELGEQKRKQFSHFPLFQQKVRLQRFLFSRGFSSESIEAVLSSIP